MKELVSVIIAVYNGEKTLEKTINSILGQTYKNIEIILIDDGSTDNSVDIVKDIRDPRMKLFINKTNSGSPVKPRNLGIESATGSFIAFCDQDDLWNPDKLEIQFSEYKRQEQKEGVGIIFSSANLINESGDIIGSNKIPFGGYLGQKETFTRLIDRNFITACSVLIPKSVFSKIGKLDENLKGVDDYDLWLRIAKKYGSLGITEPLCSWRQLKGSLSANKAKLYIETEKIFKKLGDESEEIRFGHGKNIVRIILALLLQRNFTVTKAYLQKIKGFPLSSKTNVIVKITDFSLIAGYIFVKFLKIIGKVNL